MIKILILLLIGFINFAIAEDESSILNLFSNESNASLMVESNIHAKPTTEIESKIQKIKPLVVGLALGGGAAKGFAHIGVIKALEENGIKIHIIAGTSAGSIVGSLYAYGYTPSQLEKIAYQIDEISLADFTLSRNGIIKGNKLENFVNQKVANTPLEKLKTPFIAVATDLDSGIGVGFNNGNTGLAVRASCAIPNLFIPVLINKHRYVDGGLTATVPVSYLKQAGASFIIAVDVSARPQKNKAYGFLSNLDQTLNIMNVKLINEQLEQADIVIKPNISKVSSFAFDQKSKSIKLGYDAAMAVMPEIKKQLTAYKIPKQ